MKYIRFFETAAERAAATIEKPCVIYTEETDALEFLADNVIEFEDPQTKATLVALFDRDGDGELTFAEAAAVTNAQFAEIPEGSLGSKFNEFRYFTGVTATPDNNARNAVTQLGYGVFKGVTELTTPSSLRHLGSYSFQTGNTTVILNEGLESLGGGMFRLAGTVNAGIANDSGVNISNYGGMLTIPSTVTQIGDSEHSSIDFLGYNGRFCVLKLLPTTPPTLIGGIGITTRENHILVPPNTLSTYQAASGWSSLSSYMAEWVR